MAPLRLGIVGTGSVVREIYQYLYYSSRYSPLVEVCGICDTDPEALLWFGETYGIKKELRFSRFQDLIAAADLDAVAVNTPDSLHKDPVVAAFRAGLDVILPKPLADKTEDAHEILQVCREERRFLGVDFHKREDPVVKEARALCKKGVYGRLQTATWFMLDKLLVADPNENPRFFSSADFAEKNTPVSFLTSHMADTFMHITQLRPARVRATGYSHKLPSLKPISVQGFDLVDTEVLFEEGVICHITTGWSLPNAADSLTVQSGRMLFSDGLLDLWSEAYGYREITASGIDNRNVLFRNFEEEEVVSGYGIDSPGKIIQDIARFRGGKMDETEYVYRISPLVLGFYTTLICECALQSLSKGKKEKGVTLGESVSPRELLNQRLGGNWADKYYEGP